MQTTTTMVEGSSARNKNLDLTHYFIWNACTKSGLLQRFNIYVAIFFLGIDLGMDRISVQ